jgi:ABC-type multidrug transport system ATPase subunit
MKLEIRNLCVHYGSVRALDGVDLTLRSGGLTGLVGPNGAGKSTLLKTLATLQRPGEGEILLDGTDVIRKPGAMRRVLGYLPQDVAVYPNLTAREFLSYMAAVKGLPREGARKQIDSLLCILHLSSADQKPLSGYSGGMRQRVGIACALLGDPKVIIADEPTTGLDPQERVTLRNLLSELAAERIVLLSTHIVSDVEAAASGLVLLKSGRVIFQGTPDALISGAAGHVWTYTAHDLAQVSDGQAVSSIVQRSDGYLVKTVGARPAESARPADSTLEDACLYALRGYAQ